MVLIQLMHIHIHTYIYIYIHKLDKWFPLASSVRQADPPDLSPGGPAPTPHPAGRRSRAPLPPVGSQSRSVFKEGSLRDIP